MNTRKWFAVLVSVFFAILPIYAQTNVDAKSLRVLYVGGSTNWENDTFNTPEEREKDVQRRMSSFESMLKRYFSAVRVMDAKEYTQESSKEYDVTIMDGTPNPIADGQMKKDANGKSTKYTPPTYLNEDFDQPVLFIGGLGDKMGRSIGLKLDWYCLCLDAHAHGLVSDHEIFKGPFPVKLTQEVLPTPEEAFFYEYYLGKPTPKTLPMWRVQTKGYVTDKGFRIGMVSRPWGFQDSPDTEYISSGVSQKTLDAVALGRHGNFFQWGFAASPEYMTDEAKVVLANAIVYISKFKGKGVIARKYLDSRATKDYLKELKHFASRSKYEEALKQDLEYEKLMIAKKEEIEAKKAQGEPLEKWEESLLDYKKQPEMSFEDYLKRGHGDYVGKFGTDTKAYVKFYTENEDYFYSENVAYLLTVDEDVKSLKIPNTDKRLLEKCIDMLEKGTEVDKAKRILDRYTLLNFETPREWRAWYTKNKNKIFFTQSGGWFFMVDTEDKTEPANNYKNKQKQEVPYNEIKTGETNHEQAVSVATGIVEVGNGNKEVVVKMKIYPGYHIYAFVSDVDPYINTDVKIKLPEGYEKVGELQKPSFKFFNRSGTTIYEDEIIFKQVISGTGHGEAELSIRYQCCDSKVCFPPMDENIKIKI